MSRFSFLFFLILAFSIQATAQWMDFPTGFSGKPQTKLKGAVHTVLTIEQRGEYVFSTVAEVYDLKGRLIETMNSNANIETHSGSLFRLGGKTVYSYDTSGKLTKEKNFTPEGEYTGYETYIYDVKNRLIENVLYNREGKETGKRTYTYFPEKREVIATWDFYRDGKPTMPPPNKNLLSYNEKEQWTKRTEFDSKDKADRFITFEYDAQGNFMSEAVCCEYNYSHRYSYKFDKQGNWIERQDTSVQLNKDGKEELNPEWMRKYRVITYYSDYETKP